MSSRRRAGLYLHVPFCTHRCHYCDFAIVVGRHSQVDRYLNAILLEAENSIWDRPIDTIYLGGGTPSSLDPERLAGILEGLSTRLPILPEARVHLEANPEEVDGDRLAGYRQVGVSFLSLGVQSLHDPSLRFLSRRHSAEKGRQAISEAVEAGFPTVSVDLIFGWEGQSLSRWAKDLEEVHRLGAHHLSCYQLTFHPQTRMGLRLRQGKIQELTEAQQDAFLAMTHRNLESFGWQAYEVSSFARSGDHRSLHNQKYWFGTAYLGLGPSAHSFDGVNRWWNEPRFGDWLSRIEEGRSAVQEVESLGPHQLLFERVMLGLRTARGFSVSELEAEFGIALPPGDRRVFETWAESGWVQWDQDWVKPRYRGMALADALAVSLSWGDPTGSSSSKKEN